MSGSFPRFFIDIAERLGIRSQQWKRLRWQMMCDFRVAMPGTVVSFNAVKQTVVVQPAIKEQMVRNLKKISTALPQLLDVPVVMMRAGGFELTLPITAGDECLVIFNDMCFDAWWQSGASNGPQEQVDRRRHDLSDAIAIFGPWSQPRVLSSYNTTMAELRSDNGSCKVQIAGNQVTVTAPTVNVTASLQVNISGSGHTSIEGKDWLTHRHTGVSTGSGVSGPVQ